MNGKDLYILQMAVTGDIKVGRSKHVHKRLKELQTGCPHRLRLILHAPDEGHRERGLHRTMRQRSLRRNGEWFEEGALADLPVDLYERLDLESQDWWRRDQPLETRPPPEPDWFDVLSDW
tara:strand:- start:2812 stop:3171 length:360 start_codon:yes stop_codon:yes gene_type:complete